ncbi:neurotactin-like [Actinia tenebrosa]|uniref:Neurotactin-like n=1 Tax=Actinia tenebrosa TaxID=6105 RepID=A0A6P8GZ32_ACTTE|nr:neurotactin-like [Actinia tenebrosa]
MFRNKEESRPIISLGRRSDPYTLCSDSEDDFEEIEFDKAVFERRYKYEYEPSRKTVAKRRLFFCLLFTSFISILGAVLYYYFSRQVLQMQRRIKNDELKVKINGGFIHGVLEEDVFVFKGIPYAKHPQRWQPPSSCGWNDCWNGTFQASEFGKECVQARYNTDQGNIEAMGTEDCLFINVWTPTTASKKRLPVMVYLHGGGLLSSSGHENGLHPTPEMITDMEIVGVSLNYRLDAFGFLALGILSKSSSRNTSGNYGFMDQILALQWVRENIAQFGGDPDKVTILGQGSGGTSVLALLASPMAKGLFQQAIALSPSADITKTSSEAAKDNEILLTNAKCAGNASMKLQCLHTLSPQQILKASPWNAYHYKQKDSSRDFPTKAIFPHAIAVIDGYVLPSAPAIAIKSDDINDVPLILGNTAQEIDDRPKKNFQNSSLGQFKAYAKTKLSPFLGTNSSSKLERIFNSYKIETSNKSAQYCYTTMVSDIREVCPVEYFAITAVKHFISPVYRYVVTSTPSHDIHLLRGNPKYSFHMWDLIAFYNFFKPFKYKPSEQDIKFKKLLRTELRHFFYNGEVKSHTWLKHPKSTAIFSNKGLEIIPKIYHKEECTFWLVNGFAPYAWVN